MAHVVLKEGSRKTTLFVNNLSKLCEIVKPLSQKNDSLRRPYGILFNVERIQKGVNMFQHEWVEKVKNIVSKAVETIIKDQHFKVSDKGKQDIVTDLDIQMERRIKACLKELFPEDHFIGEEENHIEQPTVKGKTHRVWVCDPIDGTLNFTQNIPYYGVQLALIEDGNPVFCLIYLPVLGEMYTAVKGEGAYVSMGTHQEGATKLVTDSIQRLEKSIVTFGDFSKSNPSSRGYQLKAMAALVEQAMRIRIQGASSVDFAYVASGKNGCHILFSKNIWELAPGTLLAEEAGCKTYRIQGEAHGFEGEGLIIAINQEILDRVSQTLESIE